MSDMEGSATASGTEVTSDDSSFASIAAGIVDASENPPAVEGDAAAAASGDETAGDLGVETAEAAAAEAGSVGSEEPSQAQAVLNTLANLNREDLSPEMQVVYDELTERYRLMQADYTRKTTATAEERKALDAQQAEFDARVASQVSEQLARFGISQVQAVDATAQAAPVIDEAVLWDGLGERISLEAALNDPDPAKLDALIEQRAEVKARKVALEMFTEVIEPRLTQVASSFEESRMSESRRTVDTFLTANPDLAPHFDKVLGVLKAGLASDLDEGAAVVRRIVNGDADAQKLIEMGVQAGRAQAQVAADNRQQFSTPSSSTAPKQGQQFSPSQSFNEIAAAVVAEV